LIVGLNLDDSADRKRRIVFSVAGLLGYPNEWFELERKWEQLVRGAGLSYFRTADYMSMGLGWGGEFDKLVAKHGLTTARVIADALVQDLKELIHGHKMAAFCLAILMPDFNEVVSKLRRVPFHKDPYIYAHHQLIGLVAEEVLKMKAPPVIAVAYDGNSKSAELKRSWVPFKNANPTWGATLGTLAPLDDKLNPSIQIADLIAHTTTDTFRSRHKDPSAGIAELREWLPMLMRVAYVDKKYLRTVLAHNARRLANHSKEQKGGKSQQNAAKATSP
jgi:hypothetical protein